MGWGGLSEMHLFPHLQTQIYQTLSFLLIEGLLWPYKKIAKKKKPYNIRLHK